MTIAELHQGGYKETFIRKTYEDAYTIEMKELYYIVTEGRLIKTTAADAKLDLEIFRMIMRAGQTNAGLNGAKGVESLR